MELINVGFLTPILAGMKEAGINLHPHVKKSGLSIYNLDNMDGYIPMNMANDLLGSICYQQGIDDVASLFSERIGIASLSQYGELITASPSVYCATQIAIKNSQAILTNEQLSLNIENGLAKFSQEFKNLNPIEYKYIVSINFAYLLQGFSLSLGDNWLPIEIHSQINSIPDLSNIYDGFNQINVKFNQTKTALIFKSVDLSKPMAQINSLLDDNSNASGLNIISATCKVDKLIDTYMLENIPNFKNICYQVGIPERTFRRQLVEEGTSFSEIFANWRYVKGISLLENKSLSIKEIAQRLHYSNDSNFMRAFKKATGLSPNKFREAMLK
ncbi:MAG: hypothetical protein COA59_16120 [Colwellia sp.]|jgi:AraC-like DNA-binding protein|nr:MAG: hypothetical protein COA59_16120 [Colwellia sp.]